MLTIGLSRKQTLRYSLNRTESAGAFVRSSWGGAGLACAVAASIGIGVACATSPLGRSQLLFYSEADMASMGLTAYAKLKQEVPKSQDPVATRLVACGLVEEPDDE